MRPETILIPKSRFSFHSTKPLLPSLISPAANQRVEFKGIITNELSEFSNLNKFLSLFQLKSWGKELLRPLVCQHCSAGRTQDIIHHLWKISCLTMKWTRRGWWLAGLETASWQCLWGIWKQLSLKLGLPLHLTILVHELKGKKVPFLLSKGHISFMWNKKRPKSVMEFSYCLGDSVGQVQGSGVRPAK